MLRSLGRHSCTCTALCSITSSRYVEVYIVFYDGNGASHYLSLHTHSCVLVIPQFVLLYSAFRHRDVSHCRLDQHPQFYVLFFKYV